MRSLVPTILLLTILLLLQPGTAAAVQESGRASLPAAGGVAGGALQQDLTSLQSRGRSLNEAVQQVKRQYPGGRIISAETKRSGNREEHRIKVLTADGKVRTVKVRGRTLGSRG